MKAFKIRRFFPLRLEIQRPPRPDGREVFVGKVVNRTTDVKAMTHTVMFEWDMTMYLNPPDWADDHRD